MEARPITCAGFARSGMHGPGSDGCRRAPFRTVRLFTSTAAMVMLPFRPLVRPAFAEALGLRASRTRSLSLRNTSKWASMKPPPLNSKTKPRESSPALSEQRFREKPRPRPLRFNIADTILHHDNGVAVVNKPAGLVTQSYTKRNEVRRRTLSMWPLLRCTCRQTNSLLRTMSSRNT